MELAAEGAGAADPAALEQRLHALKQLCRALKSESPRIDGLDSISRRLDKEVPPLLPDAPSYAGPLWTVIDLRAANAGCVHLSHA